MPGRLNSYALTDSYVDDKDVVHYYLKFDSTVANKLASALGVNCKALGDGGFLFYKGSNDQNGVYLIKTTNASSQDYLSIKIYKDGSLLSATFVSKQGNLGTNPLYLSYLTGSNSIVFGIHNANENEQIQVAISNYVKIDGASGYGYCFARVSTSWQVFNTLLDTGEYHQTSLNGTTENHENIVSMAPFVHSAAGAIFQHVYTSTCFKAMTQTCVFNLNGLEFVSTIVTANNMSRYLVEI